MKVLARTTELRILALRKRGYSLRRIAKAVGRTHAAIWNILKVSPQRRRQLRKRFPNAVRERFTS